MMHAAHSCVTVSKAFLACLICRRVPLFVRL